MTQKKNYNIDTIIAHSGREPEEHFGFVNTPVYRGSTILSKSSKEFRTKSSKYTYGSKSNPNTDGLSSSIQTLENAYGCKITSSGRTAILLSLLSVIENNDHILISDNVYEPTKQIANKFLIKMGVKISYFNPKKIDELDSMIQKNTKAIFFESPGSITFEIIEIDQLIDLCRKHNLYSIIDNTWGTPLYFKPFDYGIDISLHAGTKYIVGHSDTFIGAVSFNQKVCNRVEETFDLLRLSTSADDAYQASRGLRTIKIRMEKQFENTIKVCDFLYKHKNIEEILYPPFEHSRDHNLWKKYFKNGGASLMTIILKNTKNNLDVLDGFIDELKLFGIGASWGGYESLIMPVSPNRQTTDQWDQFKNSMVRLHIGLEDPEDLIEDLKYSLNKFS